MRSWSRHLQQAGEGYFRHLWFATRFGLGCINAGLKALAHGVLPGIWQTAASTKIKELFAVTSSRGASVVYEVTLSLSSEHEKPFYEWLQTHIEEMLALEAYQSAHVFQGESAPGEVEFVVHYYSQSREALEAYLKNHAPAMQRKAKEQLSFPIKATRRVLWPGESFCRTPH